MISVNSRNHYSKQNFFQCSSWHLTFRTDFNNCETILLLFGLLINQFYSKNVKYSLVQCAILEGFKTIKPSEDV